MGYEHTFEERSGCIREQAALRREAARRGVSVGELVREAVRRAYLRPSEEERRAAIQRILSREVDVGAWEEVKPLIGRYVGREPDAEG